MELIYLNDDIESTIDRIIADKELEDCGLDREKISRTLTSFRGDEIATSVFYKKYALRDNNNKIIEFTLSEAKDRWARTLSDSEKLFDNKEDFFNYYRELYNYFLPAGRQMFALGNEYVPNASYSNCYVTKIEDDSIEGIFDAAKKIAKTYSYGGGIGLCVGELRPNKALVSNSARYSTGAVSFMELYSLTTHLIGQFSRRGALMITIPVDHPDIEDFIEIKHNNTDKVKHANISIKLSDKFMNAVINDEDFELSFETKHEKILKVVKARELWGKIVKSARDSAEPGLLFWDRAVERSPSEIYKGMEIHSTNPCVPKDAWIHTSEGPRQVADLIGKKFSAVVNGKTYTTENGFFKTGIKRLYNIETKMGYNLRLTSNHQVKTIEGWKKVADIGENDFLVLNNNRDFIWNKDKNDFNKGYILGMLVGDGTIKSKNAVLSVFNEESDLGVAGIKDQIIKSIEDSNLKKRADFNGWINIKGRDESRLTLKAIFSMAEEYGLKQRDKNLKPVIEKTSYDFHIGFLRGFFDADGSVQGSAKIGFSVRLAQSNLHNLKTVQRMLARIGIISTIYKNRRKAQVKKMPDGKGGLKEYSVKAQHELVISCENLVEFNNLVSFSHLSKAEKLKNIATLDKRTKAEPFITKVESVESDIIEEVYDVSIPGINCFDLNGVIVHNCGEQLLPGGSSCTLASLLLHEFVKNPYTDQAYFDFNLFGEMTKRGVRHLDNIVEMNFGRHALEEQEISARDGRRIGLGITGLADMFCALNIKYDSKEALEITELVMKKKMESEYMASIDLAKERGSFKLFDPDLHFTRGFCSDLPEYIKEEGRKHGLRNVTLSTVAPNGSLSIMAHCSSGIEPIFCMSYKRFVEMGAERKEFIVKHQGIARYMEATGNEVIPIYWVASHNIDHNFRIKLQGVIQQYTDASLSSTINLPADVSEEEVGQIYINAWKEGLKGITVYREGSREGVLITEEYAKNAGVPNMDTIIRCVRAEGGDKFYIMVSYENGDVRHPYQVFVLNYKKIDSDAFVKIGNSLSKMLLSQGVPEARINKYSDRSKNSLAKLTRFLSLSMKTKNLDKAVEILDDHAVAGSLASRLCNILSDSLEMRKALCEKCKGSNVRMEEGCMHCLDCSWEKCS